MKKLLNVFYVTAPDTYLALEGENILVRKDEKIAMRLPLHNLENIVCFGYQGASPALMGACVERNIGLCFLSPGGRFLARISGKVKGNVLLRKKQYFLSENEGGSLKIASNCLIGKIYNSRKVLERAIRDHALLVDVEKIKKVSATLQLINREFPFCTSIQDLMGFEGSAARNYFSVFNQLILQQREDFQFNERVRRPPTDRVNTMLSFLYTVLANEVGSALETVGLDPYVGFLHQDRPGRVSLALDLMEELRPVLVDRLVLSLINRKQVKPSGFVIKESGGVIMDDETKKIVISSWQERKKQEILHPFLKEKVELGLLPYVQALLLARCIRGDLEAYPPFFWQ